MNISDFPSKAPSVAHLPPHSSIRVDATVKNEDAADHLLNAFTADVVTELAQSFSLISQASARGFAESAVGNDLRTTCPPPYPTRTWSDAAFGAADPHVLETLQARLGALAPYTSTAQTIRREPLSRTKLSPVGLKFSPGTMSLPVRLIARIIVGRMSKSIINSPMHIYTSTASAPTLRQIRNRVSAERTTPKGRILKALQAPLAGNRELLDRHGADVEIVAVPGLAHPTYLATTLKGARSEEGAETPTLLALCKLDHDPSEAELLHLDAFAKRMLNA